MAIEVVTITSDFSEPDPPQPAVIDEIAAKSPTPPAKKKVKMWPSLLVAVSLVVFLGGLAYLFLRLSGSHDFTRFEPSLLTMTVTFAVFAVNFSFLEYQFSPYRALFRGIEWTHVASAIAVLVLALVPIGAALLGRAPGKVAAFVLPLVAFSSIILALIARRCADPVRRIRTLVSEKQFLKFRKRLGAAAFLELQHAKDLKLSSVHVTPLHEWDYKMPPAIDFFDPFESILALASAAATNGDSQVFDKAVEATVRLVEMSLEKKPLLLDDGSEADYQVHGIIQEHGRDRLLQLIRTALETDKTERFTKGLGAILAKRLREEAAVARLNSEFARGLMKCLAYLGEETYKRGWNTTAMRTLIVARECAEKGISTPPKEEDILFDHGLTLYSSVMYQLAEAAVDKKDAEFLYRCMETLGFLGCSAVRAHKRELGTACLQALIQISRKSRYLKLECFWTRCGMLPWQHARERVQWMLTWVARLPIEQQRSWLETFSEAYSRIEGRTRSITLTTKDGKPFFQIKQSDEPHTVTYMDEATVTYDYSDESMLRDLQLY
jgi:hypothetical protein